MGIKPINKGDSVSYRRHFAGLMGILIFIIFSNIIGLSFTATGLLCDLFGVIILLTGDTSVCNANRPLPDGGIGIDELGDDFRSTRYVLKEVPSTFLGIFLILLGFSLQFLGAINIRIAQISLELVLNILGQWAAAIGW